MRQLSVFGGISGLVQRCRTVDCGVIFGSVGVSQSNAIGGAFRGAINGVLELCFLND